MNSKSMRRAMRSSRALHSGARILEFVQRDQTRQKLMAAATNGVPPVTAISTQLLRLVGTDAKLSPVKQFVGLCVRAVLEQEGFHIAAKGVRVSNDPLFRTGSTYDRSPISPAGLTFLARMVEILTDSEADELLALLKRRNPNSRS